MSISTLLARFRPSKASAEPVSRTDDPGSYTVQSYPGDPLLYDVQPDGTRVARPDALVKREHTPLGIDLDELRRRIARARDGVPPPQHPLAPELSPPPLDWSTWTRMARENQRRGWSFCRYAVKFADRMGCVFGIVRGPWGICKMDFYICGAGTFDTLNAITHLPSGMGCGLFTDQESAAAACDIAARLADDWETLDPYADAIATRGALDRMHSAWAAAGLTKCATHAHADAGHNTTPIPIWFQDYGTIIAGRPEKLS